MAFADDVALFTVSVAAELAGMHPQTLRQYDRLGLVVASRTRGRGRRYSMRDVETLREVQRLSQEEGINLAGIKRILHLETRVRELTARLELLEASLDPGSRVFTVSPAGDVVAVARGQRFRRGQRVVASDRALVLWRPPQD